MKYYSKCILIILLVLNSGTLIVTYQLCHILKLYFHCWSLKGWVCDKEKNSEFDTYK